MPTKKPTIEKELLQQILRQTTCDLLSLAAERVAFGISQDDKLIVNGILYKKERGLEMLSGGISNKVLLVKSIKLLIKAEEKGKLKSFYED